MKILIISALSICILSVACVAQNSAGNKIISFTAPKSSDKIESLALKSQIVSKAPTSFIAKNDMKTQIFEVKDVLFQLNTGVEGTFPSDRLENEKKIWDSMFKNAGVVYYNSTIKKVNNYKVLILNYQYNNEKIGRYSFFTLNNKNNKVLNGLLEYPEGSREIAATTFNEVLQGIKFN